MLTHVATFFNLPWMTRPLAQTESLAVVWCSAGWNGLLLAADVCQNIACIKRRSWCPSQPQNHNVWMDVQSQIYWQILTVNSLGYWKFQIFTSDLTEDECWKVKLLVPWLMRNHADLPPNMSFVTHFPKPVYDIDHGSDYWVVYCFPCILSDWFKENYYTGFARKGIYPRTKGTFHTEPDFQSLSVLGSPLIFAYGTSWINLGMLPRFTQ